MERQSATGPTSVGRGSISVAVRCSGSRGGTLPRQIERRYHLMSAGADTCTAVKVCVVRSVLSSNTKSQNLRLSVAIFLLSLVGVDTQSNNLLAWIRNADCVGVTGTPMSCSRPGRSDAPTLQSSTPPGSPPIMQINSNNQQTGNRDSYASGSFEWLPTCFESVPRTLTCKRSLPLLQSSSEDESNHDSYIF